jgi:hypothetical protein
LGYSLTNHFFKLIIFITLLLPCVATGQREMSAMVKTDSILKTRKSFNHSFIKITDTIQSTPDLNDNKPDNENVNKQFYNLLKEKTSKYKWSKKLTDILLTLPTDNNPQDDNGSLIRTEDKYLPYTGNIIRRIEIKKIEVFGTSINDTTYFQPNWLERRVNKFHTNTRDFILKDNLLFAEGEPIDPFIMAENEGLIRSLPYIRDVRFFINKISQDNDSVDIIVVSKDIWSIGVEGNISSLEDYELRLYDANFLGTGRKFDTWFYIKTAPRSALGFEGKYYVENIAGSFINCEIRHVHKPDIEFNGIILNRKFYSAKTKYAGGIEFDKTSEVQEVKHKYNNIELSQIEYTKADFWMGRAFLTNPKRRLRTVISTRYYTINFTNRPKVYSDSFNVYHNRNIFLSNISLSQQKNYGSSMIYAFGRNEDIPYGHLVGLTIGYENSEFSRRGYIGIQASKGILTYHKGFMMVELSTGTYLRTGKFERGVVDVSIEYFSRLMSFHDLKFRQFLKIHHTGGFRKLDEDSITINNRMGIRGLSNDALYGNRRFVINLENVCFTPIDFYGFKFVLFSFVDLAFIGRKPLIFTNPLYSGIGVGLRIRNENLVFKTLQIRLSFYPKIPTDSSKFGFEIMGTDRYQFKSFEGGKPSIVLFE